MGTTKTATLLEYLNGTGESVDEIKAPMGVGSRTSLYRTLTGRIGKPPVTRRIVEVTVKATGGSAPADDFRAALKASNP